MQSQSSPELSAEQFYEFFKKGELAGHQSEFTKLSATKKQQVVETILTKTIAEEKWDEGLLNFLADPEINLDIKIHNRPLILHFFTSRNKKLSESFILKLIHNPKLKFDVLSEDNNDFKPFNIFHAALWWISAPATGKKEIDLLNPLLDLEEKKFPKELINTLCKTTSFGSYSILDGMLNFNYNYIHPEKIIFKLLRLGANVESEEIKAKQKPDLINALSHRQQFLQKLTLPISDQTRARCERSILFFFNLKNNKTEDVKKLAKEECPEALHSFAKEYEKEKDNRVYDKKITETLSIYLILYILLQNPSVIESMPKDIATGMESDVHEYLKSDILKNNAFADSVKEIISKINSLTFLNDLKDVNSPTYYDNPFFLARKALGQHESTFVATIERMFGSHWNQAGLTPIPATQKPTPSLPDVKAVVSTPTPAITAATVTSAAVTTTSQSFSRSYPTLHSPAITSAPVYPIAPIHVRTVTKRSAFTLKTDAETAKDKNQFDQAYEHYKSLSEALQKFPNIYNNQGIDEIVNGLTHVQSNVQHNCNSLIHYFKSLTQPVIEPVVVAPTATAATAPILPTPTAPELDIPITKIQRVIKPRPFKQGENKPTKTVADDSQPTSVTENLPSPVVIAPDKTATPPIQDRKHTTTEFGSEPSTPTTSPSLFNRSGPLYYGNADDITNAVANSRRFFLPKHPKVIINIFGGRPLIVVNGDEVEIRNHKKPNSEVKI